MRESDANKLSQSRQVPLQELNVASLGITMLMCVGSKSTYRREERCFTLLRRVLSSVFTSEAAAKKPCGKSHR
jgi:hypothetical protein